ncbi:MAG TPA: RsmB/NOP family class I SAM-dependent RNA methyltransferase [Sphingobacteriaceae bacterium]|nr:RsmB/NOP family class I SAM-dependent RNA methyltransferase [Sphingobacteriaceae bacterium]
MLLNEKRLSQHLRTFEKIVAEYKFDEPLARFLTAYYKENKQMGSNDRRVVSRLLYNYFRLGSSLGHMPLNTRVAIAEFLCAEESDIVNFLEPELHSRIQNSVDSKLAYLNKEYDFEVESIYPQVDKISDKLAIDRFLKSHFKQPNLFIRIHAGKEKSVKELLKSENISFVEIGPATLSFQNGTQLDRIDSIKGKYEVQDLSSQKTVELFKPQANEYWWDACSGSGGKSITLKQTQPNVNLLVSDIRESILRNLDERFEKAGISGFKRKLIDLRKDSSTILGEEKFDGIIVDVPCSGSGTWGRTPEMLASFSVDRLQEFSKLQKEILENVIKHLKPQKPLIYITCSVYKQENEDQIEFLQSKGFNLESMTYFEGAELGADTLFAARLIREL